MKTTRQNVYKAIDSEREYQNNLGPERTNCHDHEVGEYITMLQFYQNELISAWTKNPGDEAALHSIRKIAGIAVRCMEDHGAPHRL